MLFKNDINVVYHHANTNAVETQKKMADQTNTEYASMIVDHYSRNWGSARAELRLRGGRIAELPPEFRVVKFERSEESAVFATVGMSQPNDVTPLELHVVVYPDKAIEREIAEVLAMVAYFHRHVAPLNWGHTVNLGKSWAGNSACTHGLISLPYLDGETLEWANDKSIRFLWLLPITEAERQFKVENGLEALETIFEEKSINYLNLYRDSLV